MNMFNIIVDGVFIPKESVLAIETEYAECEHELDSMMQEDETKAPLRKGVLIHCTKKDMSILLTGDDAKKFKQDLRDYTRIYADGAASREEISGYREYRNPEKEKEAN